MLIVEFSTDMALGKHALKRAPGMVIRNEEEYIHGGGGDFIFWAEGGDFEVGLEAGYYDVPRTARQTDVAASLEISSQSLSERLRRGTAALVEATPT